MSQHSWYNPNRRHYGPKPNTRRARGLHNRNYGRKYGPHPKLDNLNLPAVDTPIRDIGEVDIPTSLSTVKKYAKLYNYYLDRYQDYRDAELCVTLVAERYEVSEPTVKRAIAVCKKLIALEAQEKATPPDRLGESGA